MVDMIEISKLNKYYDTFHALKDVDFKVGKGEKIVVCGPSGSGKSTLIRCVNGLESYKSGNIRVLGEDLPPDPSPRQVQAIRRKVGMVFQQFNLFPHLSVLDNLTIAPVKVLGEDKDKVVERAKALLDKVQIGNQSHKYPGQLSGGQQQRVAIARTLCMQPEILLFDEPTSALDPEMIREVLDVMLDLAKSGVTMVCVTHEMGFARQVADRVVFMEEGKIVEESNTDVFFTAPTSERTRIFLDQILTD